MQEAADARGKCDDGLPALHGSLVEGTARIPCGYDCDINPPLTIASTEKSRLFYSTEQGARDADGAAACVLIAKKILSRP